MMKMMRSVLIPLILFAIVAFFTACANTRSIEETINQFQNAINADDFGSFKETLSEESQFWVTGDTGIQGFLDYFDSFTPVVFSNLSVSTNGDDGTVNASATYASVPEDAYFVMRKQDEVWKIKEYWDGSPLSFVWQKIEDSIPIEE